MHHIYIACVSANSFLKQHMKNKKATEECAKENFPEYQTEARIKFYKNTLLNYRYSIVL